MSASPGGFKYDKQDGLSKLNMEPKKQADFAKPFKFVVVSEYLDSVGGRPTVKPDAVAKSIFESDAADDSSTLPMIKDAVGESAATEEVK